MSFHRTPPRGKPSFPDFAAMEIIVRERLNRMECREAELTVRPSGNTGEVAMAQRLGRETTMTLRWIARHLGIGSASVVIRGSERGCQDLSITGTDPSLGLCWTKE